MILRRSIALSGSRYGSSGLLRASFSRFSAVGFAWWNEGRLVSLVGVGTVRLLCGRLNLEKGHWRSLRLNHSGDGAGELKRTSQQANGLHWYQCLDRGHRRGYEHFSFSRRSLSFNSWLISRVSTCSCSASCSSAASAHISCHLSLVRCGAIRIPFKKKMFSLLGVLFSVRYSRIQNRV